MKTFQISFIFSEVVREIEANTEEEVIIKAEQLLHNEEDSLKKETGVYNIEVLK